MAGHPTLCVVQGVMMTCKPSVLRNDGGGQVSGLGGGQGADGCSLLWDLST